jgi:phosphoglycerol transferase
LKPAIKSGLVDSIAVFLASTLVLFFLLRLWTFHPRIPFHYDGDGILTLGAFRNMQDNFWYFSSDKVGFPYGQQLQDFPAIADGFCLTLSWILIKVLRDPVMAFNAFFFLTYPLAAVAGYIGARLVNLRRLTAAAIGILYAFTPYHAVHGAPHLYLSMYPIVPIAIGMVFREIRSPIIHSFSFRNRSTIKSASPFILLGFVASMSGLYYSFFTLILFAIGVLLLLVDGENIRKTWRLLVGIIASFIGLGIQFIPILLFQRQNGSNLGVVKRGAFEVEYYSLRIIDLFLPIPQHHIQSFASFSLRNRSAFVPGEQNAYLGVLGAIGVIILLLGLLSIKRRWFDSTGVSVLSRIFVIFVLASVLGGFNQILASVGFSQIRVWARSAIFLAFIALTAIGFAYEWFTDRLKLRQVSIVVILSLIVGLGIWDTNGIIPKDAYKMNSMLWHNDTQLVNKVEITFGNGARVLQLPIMKFPEQGGIERLTDYAQLRGELHSTTLCWSYGVVIGRDESRTLRWQALGLKDQIDEARLQGFDAMWIELRAYPELGANQTKELTAILGPPVLTDGLNLVQVFDLRTDKQLKRENCHK